jgi:hypothetical protein
MLVADEKKKLGKNQIKEIRNNEGGESMSPDLELS